MVTLCWAHQEWWGPVAVFLTWDSPPAVLSPRIVCQDWRTHKHWMILDQIRLMEDDLRPPAVMLSGGVCQCQGACWRWRRSPSCPVATSPPRTTCPTVQCQARAPLNMTENMWYYTIICTDDLTDQRVFNVLENFTLSLYQIIYVYS